MFKIDSVKIRLRGNYLETLKTSELSHLIITNNYIDGIERVSIKGRLDNLEVKCNEYGVTITNSVTNYLKTEVTGSNFCLFIESLNNRLGINEFQFSDVLRLDICTDIKTNISIHLLKSNLAHLNHFKRQPLSKSVYFQTSEHSHKGLKLFFYQKRDNVIRFEFRVFKNSKYDVRKVANIEKQFLNLCTVSVEYYSKIKKSNNMNLDTAKTQFETFALFVKEVYLNNGIERVNELLSLIDNKAHGYKYKKKVLSILNDSTKKDTFLESLNTSLNNTKEY